MNDSATQQINERLGEVVEASTTSFTTQCYRLYEAPPLGSLVRSGNEFPIYGIVHEVFTRSMDPSRRPIPRGMGEDNEESVYLNNPQLNRLLSTEFLSIVVGYKDNGSLRRQPASQPSRIHSFVYQCGMEEVQSFSSFLDFMPILLSAPISAPDDVIASFLRLASQSHPDPESFLIKAGRDLAGNLSGDVRRLNNVLRRLFT